VWLLGSGFSKPLDGPLLRDLFRRESREDALLFFPESKYPELAETLPWVQQCFHLGLDAGLWPNAERFLSYVDDAYRGTVVATRQLLVSLVKRSRPGDSAPYVSSSDSPAVQAEGRRRMAVWSNMPDAFDRKAKRALASECERFVMIANPRSEPWSPYRDWMGSLAPGRDTIISFNYDRVVETAAEAAQVAGKLWIGQPGQEVPDGKIPLLKLHGSVDWTLQPSPTDASQVILSSTRLPADEILKDPKVDIAIAAPGGSKSLFVSSHLSGLWRLAEEALQAADDLMIVGYSFPDTDPTAHHRLMEAFRAGEAPSRSVHIVLGVDATNASNRLRSIARSTANNRYVDVSDHARVRTEARLAIVQHPLGTQDFIGRHLHFTTPGRSL
jgi:hypothetical protein